MQLCESWYIYDKFSAETETETALYHVVNIEFISESLQIYSALKQE